jgi:hypothetical protein
MFIAMIQTVGSCTHSRGVSAQHNENLAKRRFRRTNATLCAAPRLGQRRENSERRQEP